MIKNFKKIEIAAKVAIVLTFVAFLYYKIFYEKNTQELFAIYQAQMQKSNPYWLYLAIFLMPFNWFLEALKWQRLVSAFEKLSVWYSFQAVLAGVSFGAFTPNRVGEVGGRLLFTSKDRAVETIIATVLNSFSQILATLFFGLVGFYIFLNAYFPSLQLFFSLILILGLLGFGIILFFFYNTDFLFKLLKKIYSIFEKNIPVDFLQKKWAIKILILVKGWLKHVKVLKNYTNSQLSMALLMAFLRYGIYTFQYFCMLRFMGIYTEILLSIACITTIFLLQTSLPLPPVTGLFARGGTAVWVWSFSTTNEIAILATTFGLWIINVITPALIGLFFILRKNYSGN